MFARNNNRKQCESKPKPKITIGDLSLSTKTASHKYTKNIIDTLGRADRFRDVVIINREHIHFNFFNDLLKNHVDCAQKKGCGIEHFYIKPDFLNKNAFGMMIHRTDGSEIDFSWVGCSKHITHMTTRELPDAMRYAVIEYIRSFRVEQQFKSIDLNNTNGLVCCLCGVCGNDVEYHVDHKNPSFYKLKETFLKTTKQAIPKTFDDCKKSHAAIFKDTDKMFADDWTSYHNANCDLQILCKTCNLTKART